VSERVPGTPGGVAQRALSRQQARPKAEPGPYRGDTEVREKLRKELFTSAGQEILICILEQAKYNKTITFAKDKDASERLAAIARVSVYRELVEKIYIKADLPIPDVLREALN
jgi:hypothetical protein